MPAERPLDSALLHVRERLRRPLRAARLTAQTTLAQVSRAVFPRPTPPGDELYLHLGCGPVDHPRFVNVDAAPLPHVHHVRAIDDLAPFRDQSVGLIYACHCLEHFAIDAVPRVLREWRRVLRPGGVLRVSVPDFDKLVAIYRDNDDDIHAIDRALLGGQDARYNFHYVVFTARSLGAAFLEAGLCDVRPWQPGSSELTTFDDWSVRQIEVNGKRYGVSLNLEAVRP